MCFAPEDLVTRLSILSIQPRREHSIGADVRIGDIAVLKNLDKEWNDLHFQLRDCEILQMSILRKIDNALGEEESQSLLDEVQELLRRFMITSSTLVDFVMAVPTLLSLSISRMGITSCLSSGSSYDSSGFEPLPS